MTTTNEARFEISTNCPFSCSFCPNSTNLTRGHKNMSMKLFKELLSKVEQLKQIDTITFSGLGEPFSDKTILTKMKIVKSKGYKAQVLTNGFFLTHDLIDELIKIELDTIRISFHCINIKKYIELTNSTEEDYNRILNNIHYLISKKNINVIITSDMIEYSKEEVELLKKEFEKANLLEIWKPHNWAGWAHYRNGTRIQKTCGRTLSGPLEIQVDGNIVMCCFDFNGNLVLGNLKEQSIEEIFNSKMYKKITAFHNGKINKNLLCNNCEQLYEKDESIVIYNSRFEKKDRIGKLSTTYKDMKK